MHNFIQNPKKQTTLKYLYSTKSYSKKPVGLGNGLSPYPQYGTLLCPLYGRRFIMGVTAKYPQPGDASPGDNTDYRHY